MENKENVPEQKPWTASSLVDLNGKRRTDGKIKEITMEINPTVTPSGPS